jgi:hypothetical protein
LVTEVVEEPLKPIDAIREEAKKDRVKRLAWDQAKKLSEEFLAALHAKAEEKAPDEVAKLRAEMATEQTKRFQDWQTALEGRKAAAEKILQRQDVPERTLAAKREEIVKIDEELAKAADKRTGIEESVRKEFDDKIKAATVAFLGEVFDAVGQEKVAQIAKLGPFPADSASKPHVDALFPDLVQRYLVKSAGSELKDVKVGRIGKPIEIREERKFVIVRVDQRDEMAPQDVRRADFLQMRPNFEAAVLQRAMLQSFSFRALEARYAFKIPGTPSIEDPGADPK